MPELLCVITGKGELKEFYLDRIGKLGLKEMNNNIKQPSNLP